jgi:hypothetical protein
MDALLGSPTDWAQESYRTAHNLSVEALGTLLHAGPWPPKGKHWIFDGRLGPKTIAQRLNGALSQYIARWAQDRGLDEREVERLVVSVGSKAWAIASEKGGKS